MTGSALVLETLGVHSSGGGWTQEKEKGVGGRAEGGRVDTDYTVQVTSRSSPDPTLRGCLAE